MKYLYYLFILLTVIARRLVFPLIFVSIPFRNPAYNFNYKFNQIPKNGKEFKIVVFGRLFGWGEDGTVDGVQYYSWEFWVKI